MLLARRLRTFGGSVDDRGRHGAGRVWPAAEARSRPQRIHRRPPGRASLLFPGGARLRVDGVGARPRPGSRGHGLGRCRRGGRRRPPPPASATATADSASAPRPGSRRHRPRSGPRAMPAGARRGRDRPRRRSCRRAAAGIGRLGPDIAVPGHPGPRRDELADDDVLLEPSRPSFLPSIAASVSTRVVSWKEAADSHDSVASDALVIPISSGRPSAGRLPSATSRLFTFANSRASAF